MSTQKPREFFIKNPEAPKRSDGSPYPYWESMLCSLPEKELTTDFKDALLFREVLPDVHDQEQFAKDLDWYQTMYGTASPAVRHFTEGWKMARNYSFKLKMPNIELTPGQVLDRALLVLRSHEAERKCIRGTDGVGSFVSNSEWADFLESKRAEILGGKE